MNHTMKKLSEHFETSTGRVKSLWLLLPRFHRKAIIVLSFVTLLLWLLPSGERNTMDEPSLGVESERRGVELNTDSLSEQPKQTLEQSVNTEWQEYEVKAGDTLSNVFRNNQLPLKDLYAIVKVEGGGKPLSNIKQGQLIRYKLSPDGQLDILQLEKEGSSVMFFRMSDGSFGRSR
ncbi:LysM-like peptidoglycan-binding domain-containing protein [Aliivibrio kagoshimensis]|uniref:LysM-like peptidoglycan-binding domain-containing protein n=1 Tax=Aliivibrio kagoshimensis TaxID=2910230 RepID=UPI003D122FD3